MLALNLHALVSQIMYKIKKKIIDLYQRIETDLK